MHAIILLNLDSKNILNTKYSDVIPTQKVDGPFPTYNLFKVTICPLPPPPPSSKDCLNSLPDWNKSDHQLQCKLLYDSVSQSKN